MTHLDPLKSCEFHIHVGGCPFAEGLQYVEYRAMAPYGGRNFSSRPSLTKHQYEMR